MPRRSKHSRIDGEGTIFSNYRLITYLTMMRKIITTRLREKHITRLYAADYFQKNRKDATRDKKEQMDYYK